MPPQQAYGLLDFVDNDLGFCAHGSLVPSGYQASLLAKAGGP
jgi:hypothetical protein